MSGGFTWDAFQRQKNKPDPKGARVELAWTSIMPIDISRWVNIEEIINNSNQNLAIPTQPAHVWRAKVVQEVVLQAGRYVLAVQRAAWSDNGTGVAVVGLCVSKLLAALEILSHQ